MENKERINIDFSVPVIEKMSPYHPEYAVAFFANAVKGKLNEATLFAQEIYQSVLKEAGVVSQIKNAFQEGSRFVVDMSPEMIKAIKEGKLKLSTNKKGQMFAQLLQPNSNRYGEHIPIKEEFFRKGIDPVQMSNALQMSAMQAQLQEMAEEIAAIGYTVKDVLVGQQNDRIGLYYSGVSLYLEARNVSNEVLRNALVVQALHSLADATMQLTLTMKTDIDFLQREDYKKVKGKSVSLIDERMQSINRAFGFIHQATMFRAGVYCERGELNAMSQVLMEYSNFIEETVSKNAGFLAECDTSDNGTEQGVWKSRMKLKLNAETLVNQLNAPEKTLYLGITEE